MFSDINNIELKQVLKECESSANDGYKIALKHVKSLDRSLESAKKDIHDTIENIKSSSCCIPEAIKSLEEQLIEIRKIFDMLSNEINNNLDNLKKNLSKFSITLFGRTMSGKSTLMEILTEGDGKSIGNGSQRTTRDIRKYTWNDLEITDVPGICAFEGEEDDDIAFESAKKADLILFLLTDDAPQPAEAEWFHKVINLGKPIICAMNVKCTISAENNIKLAMRDVKKKFDIDRLQKTTDQFFDFSANFGQDWKDVQFIYVHLQAAYLAQCIKNNDDRNKLYEISNIACLKNKIIDEVRNRGKFYRIKTFIDIISNPILQTIDFQLEHSYNNYKQAETISSKSKQLSDWKWDFRKECISRIQSMIIKIKSELNSEIASFAEEHFEDKNADKAWQDKFESHKIGTRCKEIIDDMVEKLNEKLNDIAREIINELKFTISFDKDSSLKMDSIVNWKKIFKWSTTILGGGLAIAGLITHIVGASCAGPIGWAVLGVSVVKYFGSKFFKSREDKEKEARIKLENCLRQNIAKVCDEIENKLKNLLDNEILPNVDKFKNSLDIISSVLLKSKNTQHKIACELINNLMDLNKKILEEAIKLIGSDGMQYHILDVARIPGNICVIRSKYRTVFPIAQTQNLKRLLAEDIMYAYDSDDIRLLISRMLGKEIYSSQIRVEKDNKIIHVHLSYTSHNLKNLILSIQQFSKSIIKITNNKFYR